MKFSEAKEQILEKLKRQTVERKLKDILFRAEALLREYEQGGANNTNPYEWIKDGMTFSADDVLSRKLAAVEIYNERLDVAIEQLARRAKLQAICFPFNAAGIEQIDPSLKVTLSARDITLAEALKRISVDLKWPEVRWAMCDGFEGVIFPVADRFDLFPIKVGQTNLVDRSELASEEILAQSVTLAGQPLQSIAFQAEPFAKRRQTASLMKVNEEGPQMLVMGPAPGRLLWRPIEAVPAHAPTEMTDDLRKQVVADIKTKKAFQKAIAHAQEMRKAAKKDGLEAVAKSEKIELAKTGLFTRKVIGSPQRQLQQQLFYLAMQGRQAGPDAFVQTILAQPFAVGSSDVPGITLRSAQLREHLLSEAFSLVPENVEPIPGDKPYPEKPYAVVSIELPARKEVLVLQRVDYRPAVAGEYEETGRQMLPQLIRTVRAWQMRETWFRLSSVEKRVAFTMVQQ